jgi:DNA-binding MarR family transcriptional regulator
LPIDWSEMMAASDLDFHTGYLLRVVSNAVSQNFARKMAGEGVTVAEWVFLRSIYDADAIAPSSLARKMGMTKGAISKLADRLIDKRLVERTENPNDKRGHALSLSVAGRQKVPILAALADSNDAAFFSALAPQAHGRLRGLLRELIERHGLTATPIE